MSIILKNIEPFFLQRIKLISKLKTNVLLESNVELLEKIISNVLLHIYQNLKEIKKLTIELEAKGGMVFLSSF